MSLLIDALKKTDKLEKEAGYNFVPSAVSANRNQSKYKLLKLVIIATLLLSAIVSATLFYVNSTEQKTVPNEGHVAITPSETVPPKVNSSIQVVNKPYQEALDLIQRKNYQEAIALLKDNELVQSTNGESLVALAKAYFALGMVKEAQKVAKDGVTANTQANDQLVGLLAQAEFSENHFQKALDILKSAAPPLASNPTYYALMARTYIKLNQPEPAISLFKQLIQYDSNQVAWWVGLGLAYQEAGTLSAANEAYSRALKLNSDPQVALFLEHQRRMILGIEGIS